MTYHILHITTPNVILYTDKGFFCCKFDDESENRLPIDDIRAIKARFGERVDIIGYDPDKVFSAPSTILDASVFPFKIVRQGAYPRKDLEEKISLQD